MNVPDDWSTWMVTCPRGHKYHASEGGCDLCDSIEEQRKLDAEVDNGCDDFDGPFRGLDDDGICCDGD